MYPTRGGISLTDNMPTGALPSYIINASRRNEPLGGKEIRYGVDPELFQPHLRITQFYCVALRCHIDSDRSLLILRIGYRRLGLKPYSPRTANREIDLHFLQGCPDDLLLAGTVGIDLAYETTATWEIPLGTAATELRGDHFIAVFNPRSSRLVTQSITQPGARLARVVESCSIVTYGS
jgi:hypothetical protein